VRCDYFVCHRVRVEKTLEFTSVGDCGVVLIERVDYLSCFSSVVFIERGLYCVLELYLHCGAVLV